MVGKTPENTPRADRTGRKANKPKGTKNMKSSTKVRGKIDLYNALYANSPLSSEGVEFVLHTCEDLRTRNAYEFEDGNNQALRRHLRILAAMFGTGPIHTRLYAVLDFIQNPGLYDTPGKKSRTKYEQEHIAELLGLYGKFTNETSVEQWDGFIRLVGQGISPTSAAQAAGIPERSAMDADREYGFSVRYKDDLLADAIDAVRENVTVRQWAEKRKFTFNKAQRVMSEARGILRELGEIK
jgi:hypothetical protein